MTRSNARSSAVICSKNVVGEFNKCVVSDMGCVPQKPDEGLYPEPKPEALAQKFDTKLWNGKWYITSGQNELFDIFPCQVHFFTETEPGKFYGKLNWGSKSPMVNSLHGMLCRNSFKIRNNRAI